MAFFKVKAGWKRPRKREYKNYRSVSFQPDAKQKIKKKIVKKFKDLKNTIMVSFLAKKIWKWTQKTENKNYHYVSLLHNA